MLVPLAISEPLKKHLASKDEKKKPGGEKNSQRKIHVEIGKRGLQRRLKGRGRIRVRVGAGVRVRVRDGRGRGGGGER